MVQAQLQRVGAGANCTASDNPDHAATCQEQNVPGDRRQDGENLGLAL